MTDDSMQAELANRGYELVEVGGRYELRDLFGRPPELMGAANLTDALIEALELTSDRELGK